MVKWIKALVVEPGKAPEVRELPNNLKAFELTIHGYIETVETICPGCLIVYDGNYPLTQKPFKRADIQGTFIIIRVDNTEPVSLSKADLDILSEVYK
ncbi:DUF3846 domain-containing protein [Desulfosporosinus sp. BICA1-9]|uniref:DUF3846 domain-containing protein n=1 Tax=Desulfosporosinus sp. BICA1-9 TaxID=1531958 RepID=UPI00054C7B75|nr:DUF3846 domain-containing protein [Desulfosporosinus sp. BICA1-9]KJS90147.1 MAG: hypothetical protein JL57_02890 [Desulfosporosinus sp. BICA1-9]